MPRQILAQTMVACLTMTEFFKTSQHRWALLMLTLTLACASSGRSSGTDPCADFELDVKKVWTVDTRINLEAKLLERWSGETKLEVAKMRTEVVVTSMDRFARSWVMMRQATCNDHFKRDLLPADKYQSRVQCLDAALQRQNTFVQSLSDGGELASDALSWLDQELQQCGK